MAGCFFCTPARNPHYSNLTDYSTYTVGDPARTWNSIWYVGSPPCPDPSIHYWRYSYNGGPYYLIGYTEPPIRCVLNVGEAASQSCNSYTVYTKHISFLYPGTYILRWASECGAGFNIVAGTITVVAPSIATKFLNSMGGVL